MYEFKAEDMAELEVSSDRAAAIIAAADLDATMETLLRHHMIFEPEKTKKSHCRIDKVFRYEGPCGGFAAKNLMCYALGIISFALHEDITIIGEVRNKFAHANDVRSFDHPDVAKSIDRGFSCAITRIKATEMFEKRAVSRREAYLFACSEIAGVFSKRRSRPTFNPMDWSGRTVEGSR